MVAQEEEEGDAIGSQRAAGARVGCLKQKMGAARDRQLARYDLAAPLPGLCCAYIMG